MIGIGLGTSNSFAAAWKDGKSVLVPNTEGDYFTPSVVGFDDNGTVLVGRAARERLATHPRQTAAAFVRATGAAQKRILDGAAYLPEELSSILLRKIKADAEAFLQEEIAGAVLCVPAHFNGTQRSAVRNAAALAGLPVQRLLNDPSAAVLSHRIHSRSQDEAFLVFDLGGGSLDLSVVESFDKVIEITAAAGDSCLGGNSFDSAIATFFCEANDMLLDELPPCRQAVILRQAELCRQALTEQPQAVLVQESPGVGRQSLLMTNSLLAELAEPLFQVMERLISRVLADCGLCPEELDDVLLVGGASSMPVIREFLTKILGRVPTRVRSPETLIARGAGTYAGLLARGAADSFMITDICPSTLGVAVCDCEKDAQPHILPIIERNSMLPVSVEQTFYTLTDSQTQIQIAIYQGEAYHTHQNRRLGELRLRVTPAPRGSRHVRVRFTYDIDGILEVEAESDSTGEQAGEVILGERLGLTEEQLAARLEAMQKLKLAPDQLEENRLVLAKGERIYAEALGQTRELVGRCLAFFHRVLGTHSPSKIRRARAYAFRLFDMAEQQLFHSLASDLPPPPDDEG